MIGCVLSWSYLFVCTLHHLIIIMVQTYLKTLNLFYKMPQIYFVECVSKIRHIPSVIHYTIRGAVCFQFTHFPSDDWENIYTLSYYHHQSGSMNYYPLFRVRSWNNGVRFMSFCILSKEWSNTQKGWLMPPRVRLPLCTVTQQWVTYCPHTVCTKLRVFGIAGFLEFLMVPRITGPRKAGLMQPASVIGSRVTLLQMCTIQLNLSS